VLPQMDGNSTVDFQWFLRFKVERNHLKTTVKKMQHDSTINQAFGSIRPSNLEFLYLRCITKKIKNLIFYVKFKFMN
jgi:hypothetical protein